MIPAKQYRCIHSASCRCTKGHLNEDVILLVFQHLNWNPKALAALSRVCKWFDDLVKRVLWKEFCRGWAVGNLEVPGPGHFVYQTRFSRSAGRSFLMPPCKNDVLYVSDPCEHLDQSDEGDVGFFRRSFKSLYIDSQEDVDQERSRIATEGVMSLLQGRNVGTSHEAN